MPCVANVLPNKQKTAIGVNLIINNTNLFNWKTNYLT